MSIKTRIESLTERHHELEEKLHDAYVHHFPTAEIKELKMKKLLIKDEIEKLSEQQKAA